MSSGMEESEGEMNEADEDAEEGMMKRREKTRRPPSVLNRSVGRIATKTPSWTLIATTARKPPRREEGPKI
jgi:hypothetical protein